MEACISPNPQVLERTAWVIRYHTTGIFVVNQFNKIRRLVTYRPATRNSARQAQVIRAADEALAMIKPWDKAMVESKPSPHHPDEWHQDWLDRCHRACGVSIIFMLASAAIDVDDAEEYFYKAVAAHYARRSDFKIHEQMVMSMCAVALAAETKWADYFMQEPEHDPNGRRIWRLMPAEMFWSCFRLAGYKAPPPEDGT